MYVTEYERVRRFPTRFVVSPAHAGVKGERVIDETASFVVVEKIGDAAVVAIRLDPRRRPRVGLVR